MRFRIVLKQFCPKSKWCSNEAALPPHSAERLCLSERTPFANSRLRLANGGIASQTLSGSLPERQSLSTLCGGKAAFRGCYSPCARRLLKLSLQCLIISIWLFPSTCASGRGQHRTQLNRIAANEAAALESLRAIFSAAVTYQSTTGNGRFGSWNDLVRSNLLPKGLVDGVQAGYRFSLRVTTSPEAANRWVLIVGTPKIYNITGRRTFSIDEFGLIRFSNRKDAPLASLKPLVNERHSMEENEASAIAALRVIFSAEATFQSTAGNGDYGRLQELGKEGLVDFVLASGEKNGYLFKIRVEKTSSESRSFFEALAIPKRYGKTGRDSFFLDDSGVIRSADKKGEEASASDPSINR
jgi:hypothetical protein